jgi:hypothetical protein
MINSCIFKLVVASGSPELVTLAIRVYFTSCRACRGHLGRWARPTYKVSHSYVGRSVGQVRFAVLAKPYIASAGLTFARYHQMARLRG